MGRSRSSLALHFRSGWRIGCDAGSFLHRCVSRTLARALLVMSHPISMTACITTALCTASPGPILTSLRRSSCVFVDLPAPLRAHPRRRRFTPPTHQHQVGDNLFVHAGLLPEHVRGTAAGTGGNGRGDDDTSVADAERVMEKLNADTCAWMLGERGIPEEIWQSDSPLWTRVYSDPDSRDIDAAARIQLEEVCVCVCVCVRVCVC